MSTLTTTPIASKRLARELWISFASLLRSHVEMRALAAPATGLRVAFSSDREVRVESRTESLRAIAPGVSGTGVLEFSAPNRPEWFFFAEDGVFHLDKSSEEGMEMEAAVELLLDRVTR